LDSSLNIYGISRRYKIDRLLAHGKWIPMHPFSKLRCLQCPLTFDPELCPMRSHDCKTCYADVHECYICRSNACFATLNSEERDDFLSFVQEIADCMYEDHMDIMGEISRGLTSRWWFELDHPTIEACLDVLPIGENRVRTYLEHIYCQIYEEVAEEDEHIRRDRLGLY
jgi:hypothetical protein